MSFFDENLVRLNEYYQPDFEQMCYQVFVKGELYWEDYLGVFASYDAHMDLKATQKTEAGMALVTLLEATLIEAGWTKSE